GIKIAVDDDYLFTIQQSVTNGSGQPLNIRPIGLVSRATKSPDVDMWTNQVGPIGVFDDKANYEVNWKDLDEGKAETFSNVPGWLGFTDKYWLTALAPNGSMTGEFRRSPSGGYQADYALASASLAPGQSMTSTTRFFAGAKEKPLLNRYERAGIPQFSSATDWGGFHSVRVPVFELLVFLFHSRGT